MTAPTFLVITGYVVMISGIALLSVPWALIIGGAGLTAFGLYSAQARINAGNR